MQTLAQKIQERARIFSAEIALLMREELLNAFKTAAAPMTDPRRIPRDPNKVRRIPARPKGKTGAKRSPDTIDALGDRFVAYVTKHPGNGIEAIAKDMGTTTRELRLPVLKAIQDGAVEPRGEKRATKYWLREAG